VGKLHEDPKCSGIVWRKMVRLITHGLVMYQFWVIRFFLSFFVCCSIRLQAVDMNNCLKCLPHASTNCKC